MKISGLFLIFGPLVAAIAAIIAGNVMDASIFAAILRILGFVGILAWIVAAVFILNSMNTDI